METTSFHIFYSFPVVIAISLIKEIQTYLFNFAKTENFKKGTYANYLTTETGVINYINSHVLAGNIKPDPIVICNAENNTEEIANNKI